MNATMIEVVSGFDEEMVDELVALQLRAFPLHMQCAEPAEYFAEALEGKSNLNIVLRDRGRSVIGCLLAIPHSLVFEELRRWDPAMEDDPGRMYLDIIQVLPERRGRSLAYELFQKVCMEAEKRHFYKLSMHARTTTGLNRYLHRIFAQIRFVRRLENWYGCGEPFDYLESPTVLRSVEGDGTLHHRSRI